MNHKLPTKLAIFLLPLLVAAACGGDTEIDASLTGPDLGDPGLASQLPDDDLALSSGSSQLFQVEGVDVDTRSSAVERPEVASQVEFSGMLIDEGDGPVFCVGGVLESLPPQCSGVTVNGLEVGDWAQVESGVAFGNRTVVVSWPPNDDNRVELVSDRDFEQPDFDDTEFPVPDMCENLDFNQTVDVEVLSNWADSNSDKAGIAYFSRDLFELEAALEEELGTELSEEELFATESESVNSIGIGVLQVIEGEVEAAREELTAGDLIPCIEQVQFSADQLQAAQDQLQSVQQEAFIVGSAAGTVNNRVSVTVAVADLETVRAVAGVVDDPAILDLSASGIIVG